MRFHRGQPPILQQVPTPSVDFQHWSIPSHIETLNHFLHPQFLLDFLLTSKRFTSSQIPDPRGELGDALELLLRRRCLFSAGSMSFTIASLDVPVSQQRGHCQRDMNFYVACCYAEQSLVESDVRILPAPPIPKDRFLSLCLCSCRDTISYLSLPSDGKPNLSMLHTTRVSRYMISRIQVMIYD